VILGDPCVQLSMIRYAGGIILRVKFSQLINKSQLKWNEFNLNSSFVLMGSCFIE
jgi:hypothetical protein